MIKEDTNIKLDENFFIKTDHRNWILRYEKEGDINPKTGKPTVHKDTAYCANLKHALKVYCEKAMGGTKSIEDVIERINLLEEKIENICI